MRLADCSFDKVRELLGTPVKAGDGYAIYCADCLPTLEALPSALFSLTVTSPPYNIGKEYETPLPLDAYLAWCGQWMTEVFRVTVPEGAFWLNVGYVSIPGKAKAVPLPYLLWDRSPFYLLQEVVWNYGTGVAARKSLSPRNEKLLWYVKNPESYTFHLDAIRDPEVKYPHQKKNGKLRCNTLGKNPSDVWQIAKVTGRGPRSSRENTASCPVSARSRQSDRVGFLESGRPGLGPFIGSGTVAISCLEHGRKVIGIEESHLLSSRGTAN